MTRCERQKRIRYLHTRIRDWTDRNNRICFIEGGYWGKEELYKAMIEQKNRLTKELDVLELEEMREELQ